MALSVRAPLALASGRELADLRDESPIEDPQVFFPVEEWLRAFLLTLAVELPIAAFLLRRYEPSWPRLLALVFFANLASHPAVWFIFTQWFLVGTPEYVLAAEGWALGIEALFYWVAFQGLSPRRALAVSLAANAASFLLGRLLFTLWPDLLW